MSDYCFDDPLHTWNANHLEWNGGKMDGFVVNNDGTESAPADGTRAMGYYTAADAPFIYALANTFAVADRSFSSLLGPTFPNRAYMEAGSSFGATDETLYSILHDTVITIMEHGKVTWHDYYASLPTLGVFPENLIGHFGNLSHLPSFFDDVAAGRLSQVNWVDPELGDSFGAVRNDLHPPGDVQLGDQFLENAVKALIKGPQWPHMAIIFTLDEHGGLYDHVPPPPACPPDDIAPKLRAGDQPGAFDRLGVRVPTIMISPYAKPHYVSHEVYDHTSILRFIEARFILPSLTSRDANANPFFDLFDFENPALLHPPELPSVVVDEAKKAACNAKYPPPS
jgi:phospholipase C